MQTTYAGTTELAIISRVLKPAQVTFSAAPTNLFFGFSTADQYVTRQLSANVRLLKQICRAGLPA